MQAFNSTDYPKKKPWDTPYGPGKTKDVRNSVQSIDQFPPKKFCALNYARLPDDYKNVRETILPWLAENKVKGRYVGDVRLSDGKYVPGFSFKRTQDAVRFKLTWG